MLNRLKNYLQNLSVGGVALAFSGGVDSCLLLALLSELNKKNPFPLVALTMQTALQDETEISEAKKIAQLLDVNHEVLTFNPFDLEAVRYNHLDRCYYCKKAIFEKFFDYAKVHELKYVLDGTNADDLTVYRPGRKALSELGVRSPLAELGISKADIRKMSSELGLSTASKPAVPCLATRFEYNTFLDEVSLKRVAEGEKLIRALLPQSCNFRLRVHGNIARLEIPVSLFSEAMALRQELVNSLKNLGFNYVTLDMEGFRSGSFDIENDR